MNRPESIPAFMLSGILLLSASACTASGDISMSGSQGAPGEQQVVGTYDGSPYLGAIRNTVLYGEIWERPQLSKRDRSMITIAALQALYRDQLRGHLGRALDNGLTQEEIGEVILHVALYTGWPTGVTASRMAGEVFQERGLPTAEAIAAWEPPGGVESQEYTSGAYAAVPRLGELRNQLLYGDVWERGQLSKRDRSMVTVALLQAIYATNQLRGHMGRALDEFGVTQEEISEVILHLAFYAGWPTAVHAGGLAAELFEARGLPLGGGE